MFNIILISLGIGAYLVLAVLFFFIILKKDTEKTRFGDIIRFDLVFCNFITATIFGFLWPLSLTFVILEFLIKTYCFTFLKWSVNKLMAIAYWSDDNDPPKIELR